VDRGKDREIVLKKHGGLAQLARAPALQAGGRRFDSDILHWKAVSWRAESFKRENREKEEKEEPWTSWVHGKFNEGESLKGLEG
jgi:hypothetical protein